MKAIVLNEIGPPENLKIKELPEPVPEEGEIVIQLKAAALNHRDVWIRTGQYPDIKLPVILGSDGAGEVVAIGSNVDSSWMGKAVIINPGLKWGPDESVQGAYFRILGMPDNGTYAEFIRVSVENIHVKPDWLTFEEAAAIPLASLTAYRSLVSRGGFKPGETILITGIGGGVSSFVLLIAKAIGATAIVTSGSDAKLEKAFALGADYGFNYRCDDWMQKVIEISGGKGPDLVVDSVGGDTFAKALELLKPGGRLVLYGATAGLPKDINLRKIFWNQLNIMGSTMGSPTDFKNMLQLYEKHKIHPVIGKVFSLEEAGNAHQYMEQAEQFGKIVLKIP